MKRRSQNWLFLPLLVGGLAAFTVFWYGAGEDDVARSQPRFGGAYVEGVAGAAARINPLFASENDVDAALASLVFSGLTRLDDHGRAFPDLAADWNVSVDGLRYEFRLRPELLWHDGATVSAADVLYTLDLLADPDLRSPPPLAAVLEGATVSTSSPLSVTIQLAEANAGLPAYLSLGVLPRHLLETRAAADLYDDFFNQRPVGTGPYRLEDLRLGRAVLVANPSHHLGQPYIQRMELRFYRDESTLLAAVLAGEVDGGFFSSGISQHDLALLEANDGLAVTVRPGADKTTVFLNLDLTLLDDRRVRQALYYAIDRERLLPSALDAGARPAQSPLPAGSWPASSALRIYKADGSVAAGLLDESGWRLSSTGVRTRNGRELALELATNNDPVRVAVARAVADAWLAIGVRASVATPGTTVLLREMLEPRDFDAVLFSYRSGPDPDPYVHWHSSQAVRGGNNLSSFDSSRGDDLLEATRSAVSVEARNSAYAAFEELFAQELPALPLYDSATVYVQRMSVSDNRPGYMVNPGGRFWQVQDWFLSAD